MESLTPDTLLVHTLDFSEKNAEITLSLNKDSAEPASYYLACQYHGLIDVNNRYFLVSRECHSISPQIDDVKNPKLIFELGIMEEFSDAISVMAHLKTKLSIDEIETIRVKTNRSVSLKTFMGEAYQSNSIIHGNMRELLRYVNVNGNKTTYSII